ncbi:MAG: hypothetical protein AB7V42_14750 [Thermoleophilia bacterium]
MRRASITRRGSLAIAAVAVPAVIAAAPATLSAAPTIASDAVCVTPIQPDAKTGQLAAPLVNITGSGFTPNGQVQIGFGTQTLFTVANPDGTLTYQAQSLGVLAALEQARAVPLQVIATDVGGQGASNPLALQAAPLTVTLSPRAGRPTAKATYRLSGFAEGKVIWGHWRYKGRIRATVSYGRAKGPCGVIATRRTRFPIAKPQAGTWKVQFDQVKKFSPRSTPRVDTTRTVTITYR